MMITLEQFDQIELRVGTVVEVSLNRKARKPAYAVTLDFGEPLPLPHRSHNFISLKICWANS